MMIIRQPLHTKLCGHCCVAMVSSRSVKTVVKIIGHERSTTTRELVLALKKLGMKSSKRLQLIGTSTQLPRRAILKVKCMGKRNWHWVAYHNGLIFDPGSTVGGVYPLSDLCERYKKCTLQDNVVISSYLEILP